MKYESYTEQMNSVPLKKRFHSQSKTSPTHPEFNMSTSPTQHSPQPTTPPANTTTTPPSDNNINQITLDSSNDSMMITTTIDNSTTLPPSTPMKEEVKTEKSLNALLSPTSTTIDALASLHLQSVSASNSPSNESTTTTTSSSTCNSSSPEDSGSNRKEPTSSNTNSSTSVTDSPNSSNKKRRQFINRANKKKEDKQGDSDSGEDSDDSENDSSEEDETLYCKCNRPASYGWMIACDRCDKWFHGRCLGLKKYQANSIGTYICPDCETTKKRKSTSINPSPSKSGRNNRSETTASSLAKDLPPKQITNHL